MTVHVFGAFVTSLGTAANNRGLTEGNTTTLQKLVWRGQVHSTVSAESIRFALRRRLSESEPCNRNYDESTRTNEWRDPDFLRWSAKAKEPTFIDDDLLGYMSAKGAKDEGGKGDAKVRRAVLEVTRAVSLTPWSGDVTFNAASPGATPSAQKKGSTNPVPYATELHATRYQYAIALTPTKLAAPERAKVALRGLCALGEVAGNHGRFLFDFSPESVVFRVTHDPAPRILYAFDSSSDDQIGIGQILRKVRGGDILPQELVIGGAVAAELEQEQRDALTGATIVDGVRAACEKVCSMIGQAQ
jgi:CRISPR-associated protein Cst2